ncbi:MAG: zinc ribbon domain-containing protein [Eubacteriales bacterium]
MICGKCGTENKKGAEICENCGEKLEQLGKTTTCKQCGKIVPTKYQFCPFCGSDIWEGKEPPKTKSLKKPKITGGKIVLILGLMIIFVFGMFVWGITKYAAARMRIDEKLEMAEAAKENSALNAAQEDKSEEAEEEVEEEATEEESDSQDEDGLEGDYDAGEYEVGVDIPEGTYLLINDDFEISKLCYFYNAPSRDLLNEYDYGFFFGGFDVVYIADGDFINLNHCVASPLEDALWMFQDHAEKFMDDDGMYYEGGYIVGDMIPAGTYEVVSYTSLDSDIKNYAQVWSSVNQRRLELRHEADEMENNVYYVDSGESTTITLEEGQYVYCSTVGLRLLSQEVMLPKKLA